MSELVRQYVTGVGEKGILVHLRMSHVDQKKTTLQGRSRGVFTFILLSDVLIGLHIILLL